MLFPFVRFGVKAGLTAGFVYFTIQEGIWSHEDQSERIYSLLCKNVAPYFKEAPLEVPKFPRTEDISYLSQYYWNKGVKTSFNFIQNLPQKSSEWSHQGWKYVQQQLNNSQKPSKTE